MHDKVTIRASTLQYVLMIKPKQIREGQHLVNIYQYQFDKLNIDTSELFYCTSNFDQVIKKYIEFVE